MELPGSRVTQPGNIRRQNPLYQHVNIQRPLDKRQTPHVMAINMLLTFGYMAGIYWLSSIPGDIDPESPLLSSIILWTPPAIHNLAHMPLFGVLAWLWYRSLSAWMKNSRLLFGSAFLLATGFGILDEWHQLYVPGRYASLTDIALNSLGAAFAVWLISRPVRTTCQFSPWQTAGRTWCKNQ